MGKIFTGILGAVSGKVAGVVGGRWKTVDYLRGYTIPSNPNTASQQTQRTKFKDCVAFATFLVGPVFNVYTDKFLKSLSGFNFFVSHNVEHFTATPAYANLLITEGKLYVPVITSMVNNTVNSWVEIKWSTSLGNNGSADDKIFGLVYNTTKDVWGFFSTEELRSAGATGHQVVIANSVSDVVECYIWAAKYVGTVLDMISNSDHGEHTCS
jgi:hypothetical protein